MKKYLLPLMLLVLFSSCKSTGFMMASAQVTMLSEACPAKTEDEKIEVFVTNSPTKTYNELAIISCRDTDDDWCLKQITAKAKEIGADGIIILGNTGSVVAGLPVCYGATSEYGMKALAFKYN